MFAGSVLQPVTKAVTSSAGIIACNDTQLTLCQQVAQNISVGTVLVGFLDTVSSAGASLCTSIARVVQAVESGDPDVVALSTVPAGLADIFLSYSISIPSVAAVANTSSIDAASSGQGRHLMATDTLQLSAGRFSTPVVADKVQFSTNGIDFGETDFSFKASLGGPDESPSLDFIATTMPTSQASLSLNLDGTEQLQFAQSLVPSPSGYGPATLATISFPIDVGVPGFIVPGFLSLMFDYQLQLQLSNVKLQAEVDVVLLATTQEEVSYQGGAFSLQPSVTPSLTVSASVGVACSGTFTPGLSLQLQAALGLGAAQSGQLNIPLVQLTTALNPSFPITLQAPSDTQICPNCVDETVQGSLATQPHLTVEVDVTAGLGKLIKNVPYGAQYQRAFKPYDADIPNSAEGVCFELGQDLGAFCANTDFSCNNSPPVRSHLYRCCLRMQQCCARRSSQSITSV